MATVFMKWLETSPKNYDRGIQILTLGRLRGIQDFITNTYIQPGQQVLEIGCGTGAMALRMAEKGAQVCAIDVSPVMLAEAQHKVARHGLDERVTLVQMDAGAIDERLSDHKFDLVIASLVFSEMPESTQEYVLQACSLLLEPGGKLLIVDETIPDGWLRRLVFHLIRLPLVFLTWLLTRTTITSLENFDRLLDKNNFQQRVRLSKLGGSLRLYESWPSQIEQQVEEAPVDIAGRLQYRVTLRTILLEIWTLFFRLIPPYPKVKPGLYAVGNPNSKSPVLVTGNFALTVRRLTHAVDGKLDAWVLVADSGGINVWCAAGGGFFSAEKVIAAITTSRLEQVVVHHALILPQLCANGVDGWKIRRQTGWGVHWGPARAEDIPAYLENQRKKTDAMRWVRFPLMKRLEMVTVTLSFYGLMILLPILIFWRQLFWPVTASLLGLSYFYAIVHPWLPGRDGLYKSIPLTGIALGGLLVYNALWPSMPVELLFNWALGLTGLSLFTAAEMQGMSPLMRGEQANWGWEAVIFSLLLACYWLFPLAFGWR